jgi:hypothetical protein
MDLDRSVLARLDRRLLSGLDRDERFQMVRVPVSPATWATWKRYCGTVGISMGRGIAALLDHELASALDGSSGATGSLLEEQTQRRLADREAALATRERELRDAEERLGRWSERLRGREHEVELRERRVQAAAKRASQPVQVRAGIGRNVRCPCGSGRKYKHCHGASAR